MKMTFGKNKGKEVSEINESYLNWLLTLDNLQSDLRKEIETVLNKEETTEVETQEVEGTKALDYTLFFGKFKGSSLRSVLKEDSQYYLWLLSNTDNTELREKMREAKTEFEEEERIAAEKAYEEALEIGFQFSINTEENRVFVKFPFALKADFRAKFKTNAKWHPCFKMWSVKNSTRNLNILRAMENCSEVESFEYTTYEVKVSEQEIFEDLCHDFDCFDYQSRAALAKKEGFSSRLNFNF